MAQKNKHFILFKSSDIFCIATGTCGQPYSLTDPSLSYQEPLGYYLLTPFHLKDEHSTSCEGNVKQCFRTVHDHLHVIEQTIDDLHGLRCSHPRFLHSESVQSLQHRFNIVLA
jgi:hypothetical protein